MNVIDFIINHSPRQAAAVHLKNSFMALCPKYLAAVSLQTHSPDENQRQNGMYPIVLYRKMKWNSLN
jgi:hypothetical protein